QLAAGRAGLRAPRRQCRRGGPGGLGGRRRRPALGPGLGGGPQRSSAGDPELGRGAPPDVELRRHRPHRQAADARPAPPGSAAGRGPRLLLALQGDPRRHRAAEHRRGGLADRRVRQPAKRKPGAALQPRLPEPRRSQLEQGYRGPARALIVATHRSEPSFGPAPDFGRPSRPAPPPEAPGVSRRPWFSWTLMAACVVAFIRQLLDPTGNPELQYSVYGQAIARGEWWRVLTAQVEHHGLLHLVVNGTSILGFAPFIERRIGGLRLALASLICGVFSSAFALYFNWNGYTAGASGMIIGWL